jgi:hypothetical protein
VRPHTSETDALNLLVDVQNILGTTKRRITFQDWSLSDTEREARAVEDTNAAADSPGPSSQHKGATYRL